ncbi:MAG: DHH family phosphoesterase [Ruminococcus sp.]|nr:DHH family phosphoesterase [Ruminococcus sp.]
MKRSNGLNALIRLTIAVVALSGLISAYLLNRSPDYTTSGKVLLTLCVISVLLLIFEGIVFQNHTRKSIAKLATAISKTEKNSLMNFPAPAVIIDSKATILWYNKRFAMDILATEEAYGWKITDIGNIDMQKVFTPNGDLVCLSKRFYEAKAVHNEQTKGALALIFFNDISDYIELKYETRQSHKAVIIINVDNLDDIMANIRESEKAHIVVEIEKLIENFVENTTAVTKKTASDRFYIYMEERHLAPIIEARFKILEQARKITVDGRNSITLSIGVGRSGENLAVSESQAKQALELCQGRGGDQAAVHEDGEFKFFGGVSNSNDKNNKVKVRMVAKAMHERITSFEKVLIMGHRFADLDAVGAATGLCCAIKPLVKEAYVVVDPINNLAKPLIEHITDNNMTNYYITPQQGLEMLDFNTLLIVVDTHNPNLVESADILQRAKEIIVIDHHRRMVNGIEPTLMTYLEPGASSACELVTDLIEYFGEKSKISVPAAEALLSGIMLDTKNFVMRTGSGTFEAAAYLKRLGADTITVKKLFANSMETYQQKSMLINSAEVYRNCAIAYTKENFANIRVAASQAADDMLGITDVLASFVLYESNSVVNISARSMGAINVQVIMESLGGGGHHTMAACQLKTDLQTAMVNLKKAIDEYIKNNG